MGPSANIQYQVINLSPDLQPVDLYIKFLKFNSFSFVYPSSSGYFPITQTDTPFQIRQAASTIPGVIVSTANIFNLDNVLRSNTPYTLIITGLKADSTLASVFLTDTDSSPKTGRGKVRFINASPGTQAFDITANDSVVFKNVGFAKASTFKELPAGTYTFNVFPTGNFNNRLASIPNITVLDGRLYNFYTYGLPGHTTDTLAFGSNILIVPIINK